MFFNPGVYTLIDGQYGSTGKGVLGAHFAAHPQAGKVDVVISNAGPNSGHTFYHGTEKHVLKQLPTFGVASKLRGRDTPIFLTPGALIDPEILNREVEKYRVRVYVHANAVMITPEDKEAEHSGSVAAVAGTRQGVGAALARKVLRDPTAVVGAYRDQPWADGITITNSFPDWRGAKIFSEVSQGFSLGINSQFYPKTTSRECTVMQALADARIPPTRHVQSFMVIRTFPIRVGNHEGFSSGDCYEDQEEISWETLGVTPEVTTVTQRVRRVFTFSWIQFAESLKANDPNLVFVNFMNYLKDPMQIKEFETRLRRTAKLVLGREPVFLWGYGPSHMDIRREPTTANLL